MFEARFTYTAAAVALYSGLAASQSSSNLPTVDLGYQIQQATLLNVGSYAALTSEAVG